MVARNKGFSEEYFVSSFISGLKESIKGAVRMSRPQLLVDDVFLAMQEKARTQKMYSTPSVKPTTVKSSLQHSYSCKISTANAKI